MVSKLALTFGVLLSIVVAQDNRSVHADDKNGDGKISRSEWKGNIAEFRQLDVNRDGVLSGNEVPGYSGRDRRGRSNRTVRTPGGGKLDKNASGVVEGYEWPYNPNVFHQLDTNGDSVLSDEELKNITAATLNQLDRNRDGKVDSDEWPGGYPDFKGLDENSDGKISSDEYFQRGSDWQRRQRFDNWDTNRNGVLEQNEWKSTPELFRRVDKNRDSRISREEFLADVERYNPPYPWWK